MIPTQYATRIAGLDRKCKLAILLIVDIALIILSLYAAFGLRYGTLFPSENLGSAWMLFPIMVFFGSIFFWRLSISRIKLKSFDAQAIQRLTVFAAMLTLTAMSFSFLLKLSAPRSVPLIFGVIFFTGNLISRIFGQLLFRQLSEIGMVRSPVLIYGAGDAGMQLASALQQSAELKPIAFLDDNRIQQNLIIFGLKVHAPSQAEALISRMDIKHVLVAIQSLSRTRRKEILKNLEHLPCEVRFIPSHIDLIAGQSLLEHVKPVKPEDLLARRKLDLSIPDIENAYEDKVILVSGAGGSIGSELCRQVLKFSPRKLIMLDRNEHALYEIERNFSSQVDTQNLDVVPVLGDVCDAKRLAHILREHNVQVVLHAAAYKHVPMVESNEIMGLKNNVLGTQTIAQEALKYGVERFVLVSTDKAVRPTNVMGATKRLAELFVQDFDTKNNTTIFSMVRFGNVLGSSGSVIPLFKEQISKGGPITLTHNDVTRYFMAVSEAAYLVLVAGSFATGGDVFVLDMGQPVKIADLARNLIIKSGLTVKDAENPDGDIEISTVGLRPGEKLYEELLIDANTMSTPHPKIMRAKEQKLPPKDIKNVFADIEKSIAHNDTAMARALISKWVEGYAPPHH